MPASSTSLFPYAAIRSSQDELISDVHAAVSSGGRLIAHAPTGLGKTAAVIAPALSVALEKGLAVFFLTSRHTQHAIAIETLKAIKEKHQPKFSAVDLVGKKNMCARDEVESFPSRHFHDYCRSLREKDNCDFFLNFRKDSELTPSSRNVLKFISSLPSHAEEAVSIAKQQGVCPYEVAAYAAKDASVIVADYNHIFNAKIRESFFKRSGKSLESSIIIVDEAHNLPGRMREMLTQRLSTFILERAVGEAAKWDAELHEFLVELQSGFKSLEVNKERLISKDELLALNNGDWLKALERMYIVSESVLEDERQSYIGSVADFVAAWMSDREGFSRILDERETARGRIVTVSYHCLDPSVATKEIISQAHSVVMMSGTLTPPSMYRDILGFPPETVLKEYVNPMPPENRLALIVRGATTKFSERSALQYRKIAGICAEAASSIPGNVALFFPSYFMMEQIHVYLHEHLKKKVFKERQDMSKEAKQELLRDFRQEAGKGGVLLAVIGGNFSEGIDLPGKFLNGVVIVGMPFVQPGLFTKELINYYDRRFGRGWDYGYIFPAFTKALQCAGRCIRSETDRGVMVFVDDRYAWPRYYKCFPKDLAPSITTLFRKEISVFFGGNGEMRQG